MWYLLSFKIFLQPSPYSATVMTGYVQYFNTLDVIVKLPECPYGNFFSLTFNMSRSCRNVSSPSSQAFPYLGQKVIKFKIYSIPPTHKPWLIGPNLPVSCFGWSTRSFPEEIVCKCFFWKSHFSYSFHARHRSVNLKLSITSFTYSHAQGWIDVRGWVRVLVQ